MQPRRLWMLLDPEAFWFDLGPILEMQRPYGLKEI
jgi:hypothetical protein